MRKLGAGWVEKPIMEGFSWFLTEAQKTPPHRAKTYVDLVRRFHNHVGRSYYDITKRDIQGYMFHLGENEHFKDRSLYIHLTAIRKFYEFLNTRGDVTKIPTEGLTVKDWHKCRAANKGWKEKTVTG